MAPFFQDNQVSGTEDEHVVKLSKNTPYTNGGYDAEDSKKTNGVHKNGSAEPYIDPALKKIPVDISFKADVNGGRHTRRAKTALPHFSLPGGPQGKTHAKVRTYTDDPDRQQFPRISKPVELMRGAYDVVVIGSGYGGGVAASRMARGNQSVCLLERGKEKWPGEYPSGFLDSVKDLHVSGDFAPGSFGPHVVEGGNPTGLYHLILGQGQNAFVGNGLGGTSLLNANVFLEADEDTLNMKEWPKEIREESLKPYYERAAEVLQPEQYPEDWPSLPKLNLLEKQSEALGLHENFRRVRQTTRFVDGPNSTGVEMNASALTGQDCTGINDGSKSSTLVNYLSDAWNWGAEMFCECEVRYIKKHPEEGYIIFYAWHGGKRGAFKQNFYEDLMWIHAKKCVFLGAGSLGTTEILLRSKQFGLSMSKKVGTGMSGNGDILAFGYDTDDQANAIGKDFPSPYNPIGPTINGIIDCRSGHKEPLDGFVIEEGAVPEALSHILQFMIEHLSGKEYKSDQGLIERARHLLARQGSRFLGPYFKNGSIEKTQIYLIMSHDSNQAILTLKNDKPSLRFLGVGRSEHVLQLNNILAQATAAVGGTFVGSPFYAMGQQEITVHPIGGACMSSDGTGRAGVTNHCGEVFTGMGKKTHDGLIVTDGAVIPTALGANPFATITALAERSVEHAAKKFGIDVDQTQNELLDLFKEPAHPHLWKEDEEMDKALAIVNEAKNVESPGFGFSEIMKGFIHTTGTYEKGAEVDDYETATKTARSLCQAARFFLSVKSWNLTEMLHKPDHTSMLTGTFVCAGLPGNPFMVHRGDFHLFNQDLRTPGTRNLAYEFDMTSVEGKRVHFQGFKLLNSSVALNPLKFWQAASTLYVTLKELDGAGNEGKIIGRGTMHIQPMDFGQEIATLSPSGQSLWSKARSTANFLTYFTKQAAGLFFTPLINLQYPSPTYTGFITNREIYLTHTVEASDHVKTMLQQYEPNQLHPSQIIDPSKPSPTILMIPGLAVDHQIFATPTIKHHSVDYFTDAGYRVYVITTRVGKTMAAEHKWTTFDARLDIKAALQHIRYQENRPKGEDKIYVIAHCMGSVAFSSGLLDGTIPAPWIKGITASAVFMNPKWATINLMKANTPIPIDRIYNAVAGHWYSCNSSPDDTLFQRTINQALRFYPVAPNELCNSVTCHRTSFTFGRLWNHHNLNDATHRQLSRFFGGVNMTLLSLVEKMGTIGHVTANAPLCLNLVNPSNLRRLQGIKMLFFSGADNKTITPESTDISYSILRDRYGSEDYQRVVFEGYGHLDPWMGRRAYKDIWPRVLEHIDMVYMGEEFVSEMIHNPNNPDGGFVRVSEHHDG